MKNKIQQIFVVGSSRSGTTMMGRILGNHPEVFTFKELHFFGTIWTNQSANILSRKEQIDLYSRLLCIQKKGLFHQENIYEFNDKSKRIIGNRNLNALAVYDLFLTEISKENDATISCEQTPKNMYYLDEILSYFPNAKIINMVRDQRDVLLSQKNKWKRKFLGASDIPFSEALRSYINYHPILTSKIWSSSLNHSLRHINNERVKIVKFEELLLESERLIKEICEFLDIDFQKQMLEVPVIGSSTGNDEKRKLRIDSSKINQWKNGGLLNAEVFLSQKMSNKMLKAFGYSIETYTFPPLLSIYYLLIFPFKLGLAFIMNIHRTDNIVKVIRKRFFIK